MVKKFFLSLLFLFYCTRLCSQPKLFTVVEAYTESQQRLLLKNTGRFLHVVHQGQWDLDSSVLYACRYYGLSRMLPYDEIINGGQIPHEITLLGQHRVSEVVRSAASGGDEKNIRIWLALAAYYLHMPGAHTEHLDSASLFVENARLAARRLNSPTWLRECDVQAGELLYQKGDITGSTGYFRSVLNSVNRSDLKRKALAHHQLALHLPYNDTSRLRHLETAYASFTRLKLNEHAIETFSDIITYNFSVNFNKALAGLKELIVLEQSAGYKHVMDSYFVLSYLMTNLSDYMGAITYSDSCIMAMRETGDSMMYSMTCFRLGFLFDGLDESEKAYGWYRKALERMDVEPQLFWYKTIYTMKSRMAFYGKIEEYFSLLTKTIEKYPPEGKFDSLHIMAALAFSYDKMNDDVNARKYFDNFLDGFDELPREYVQVNMQSDFIEAGRFYLKMKDYSSAKLVLKKSYEILPQHLSSNYLTMYYSLLYTLDSIDGNFKEAFANYQKHRYHRDINTNIRQQFKARELNILHATERKDQDIKFLKQERIIHQSDLQRARQTKNIILAGVIFLVMTIGLLYNQYRGKQKSAQLIEQKNTELVQLVDEKEWLLKEVHHRVKNSLQTVVSLLELQSEYLNDDALAAIQASQNRIYATSLLHQKLYQLENSSAVDMQSYLPELITNIKEAYNVGKEIDFTVNVDSLELDVSQAVPVGLIVNEAITNSIKYAFNGGTGRPYISVSFNAAGDEMVDLVVSDNGSGFRPNAENGSTGLGLKLIRGLGEDIDGEVHVQATDGTRIYISFKRRSPLSTVIRQHNFKSA